MSMDNDDANDKTLEAIKRAMGKADTILTAKWTDQGVGLEIESSGAKIMSCWLALGIAIQQTMGFENSGIASKSIFKEDGSLDVTLARILMSVIARVVRESDPKPAASVRDMRGLDAKTIALLKLLAMASPATGDN